VLAFALLGVAASGFMGMRALGVGPGATLVSKGVLTEREPILLAEFESASGDSVLASAVTEALRVDLETSPVVMLVQPSHVQDALRRMRRDPASPLTESLATEVAVREGFRAILVGEVTGVGGQYALSARLIGPDGSALAAVRETAKPDAVIEAADRISAALRERLGETFKSIRSTEPLAKVTTASLEALHRYSQGVRAYAVETDRRKSIVLLQEAVERDSAFAMAWRKLGVAYYEVNVDSSRAAVEQAYRHRDRLSDRERYLTEGTYFDMIVRDTARAMVAYETLLDLYPDDETALHNLARLHSMRREPEEAAELYERAIAVAPYQAGTYRNLARVLATLGRYEDLDSLLSRYEGQFPDHFQGPHLRGALAALQFRYDEALPLFERTIAMNSTAGGYELRSVLLIRGRYAEERRAFRESLRDAPDDGEQDDAFTGAMTLGFHRFDFEGAADLLERWAGRLNSMPVAERPYWELTMFNVAAGRVQRAEQLLGQWRSALPAEFEAAEGRARNAALEIAAAKGDNSGALGVFRRDADDGCLDCWMQVGRLYDAAGARDSAIAAYERYLDPPRSTLFRVNFDRWFLPGVLQRLGELHEQAGNREAAARYYGRFVELWANADPELQPLVERAKAALARLAAER
jgi:tetratricopeptide (TPR) repeat protein